MRTIGVKMGVNGPKEETGHADSRLVKKTNLVQSSECMSIVDADMRFPL